MGAPLRCGPSGVDEWTHRSDRRDPVDVDQEPSLASVLLTRLSLGGNKTLHRVVRSRSLRRDSFRPQGTDIGVESLRQEFTPVKPVADLRKSQQRRPSVPR